MVIAPAPRGISLALRLLGPFEAHVNGSPLPRLRSRHGYRLLALLILQHGSAVERSWLAGVLWPDSSESNARANLRESLKDLRRALGPEADRLRAPRPRLLQFSLADAEIDVIAFDAALQTGERDLDEGSMARAVALYRGPLLQGWWDEWILPEREIREQALLGALERLASATRARRDFAAAERWLRQAVAVDPLRESAHRALMQTLAAGGNHAAATQTYRELRLLLHRDLNAEPAPETRALYQRIRETAQRAAAPRAGLAAPPAGPSPRRLPRPLTPLVGREEELRAVEVALDGARLLTLTGPGGVGKTRLALQVAEAVADEYAEGTFFVELAGLADGALLLPTIAAALGVPENPAAALDTTLREFLRSRQILLVLDNCEHLVAACAGLAESWLHEAPHLRILATSRQSLGLLGEACWPVPPLSLPEPQSPHRPDRTPDALMRCDAVRLFAARAAAVSPSFTLTSRNAEAVARVCRRLDGLPLAIELATAWVRVLPVDQIAARLEDRFALLTGSPHTSVPRHQTLRAAMEWSYRLLSETQQGLLRRLSVFRGGWTLEAAAAVCGAPPAQRPDGPALPHAADVLGLLAALVDRSLVHFEERDGQARYRMLETIREYAAAGLTAAGEADEARGRHTHFYLEMVQETRAAVPRPAAKERLDHLEREHDNLRAALEWAEEKGEIAAALEAAVALWPLANQRGHYTEQRARLERLLTRPEASAPTAARGWGLVSAGRLAWVQGDYATARHLCGEAERIGRAIGDRPVLARALDDLGFIARREGDLASARAYFADFLAIKRELGDEAGIGWGLLRLAQSAADLGRWAEVRAYGEECVRVGRRTGHRELEAFALAGLGSSALVEGDHQTARARFEEALALARSIGTGTLLAKTLLYLAEARHRAGEPEAALPLLEESLALNRQLGSRRDAAECLLRLGNVHAAAGRPEDARGAYEEALPLWRQEGNPAGIAVCLEGLAGLAAASGDAARATRVLAAAGALREAHEERMPGVGLLPWCEAERLATTLRAALGEDAFTAAWVAGRAMTLEEARTAAVER